MSTLLKRHWIVLVAVVVVALAAFAAHRFQAAFGSQAVANDQAAPADEIVPFNPKQVVLEVFGDPGATATITYLDVESRPKVVNTATLPWRYEDSTTTPAVITNIAAQGDGGYLNCRITIDGVVKVERSATGPSAYTFCLDKSA